MTPGEVYRITWVTEHPSGRMLLRDDTVRIASNDGRYVEFDFVDGFASVRIERHKILGYELAEVSS